MWRQGGTICLWSFSVVAAVAVLFVRGQKPVPHGCDLDKESKGASKCAQENFKGKFDQVMAEKLVIGCITGNLTIAEFRNRCREPPLIKFVEKPSMNHLARFQNCVVKTIYPLANLFR
ncbi:uncharacterized protein LOC119386661 isoform X2 [Rhipicephalus sanguineus]|uniref:uncharacterized protein LOC119386661 isoform X2 n=1 Tax=Rhipicephalus sanguineus TaxID=34632 RepID=UPI001892D691|nr:uncharacterized protein LOC119386661 isoform X2 [Rhipicephalus sanguineus]